MAQTVICVENLGVQFLLQNQKVDNLKEFFIKKIKREIRYKQFWALRNVTFEVK